MKAPRSRHIPQRTCIACQLERPKRELIRIVRTPAGRVEVDPTGKKAGRGAYICRSKSCWELAFKKKALEHSLQTQITSEDKAALVELAGSMTTESQ